MKFQPGQSGNPAGRPINPVKALARQSAPAAFQTLLALMQSPDERIALQACTEVLNRAWGRPAQAIVGGDEDEGPVTVVIRRFFQP